jgi:hypothetical protein
VRRCDGRSLGRFYEELAEPLAADLHIGLGPAEEKRTADITALEPPPELMAAFQDGGGELPLIALAFVSPAGTGDHNCARHRRAEIPAINGHGTVGAQARVYGALARGGDSTACACSRAAAIESARSDQACAEDALMGVRVRMGLGYWLSQPGVPGFAFGPNEGAFGHPGAGGSLGFGYVTNRMGVSIEVDPRPQALIDAVYVC